MPPGTMFVNTNWSPTDSAMSRPAFFRRSWSGVFGRAFSMPVIEMGIRACWMKRNCSSKMAASSLSKPTIMPAITSMPAAWIRWTEVTMSSRVFCVLFDSCEARLPRGLDAHEDRGEAGPLHEGQELVVLGDVEADLGHELDGIAARPLPVAERRQEGLGLLLVADEVVVHDEDVCHAERVDRLHLGQHLGDGLGPRAAAVHHDDVAELAVVGAAARELDGHAAVALDLEEIEARQRRVQHAGLLVLAVLRPATPRPRSPGRTAATCTPPRRRRARPPCPAAPPGRAWRTGRRPPRACRGAGRPPRSRRCGACGRRSR